MTFAPNSGNVGSGVSRRARPGVVIVKGPDGELGWRSIDRDGRPVSPRFGKIYGQEGERIPAAEYDLSRRVIETTLRSMLVEKKAATSVSARAKRTQAAKRKALAVVRNRKRRRAALADSARRD